MSWPEFRPTQLLRRLTARGVDFVVVGGIAGVAHGAARLTQDLDICYAPDQANLDALGDALTELRARLRGVAEDVPFVPDGATLRRTQFLTLDSSEGPIDLLVDPAGSPGYAALRRQAERLDVGGLSVLVASLHDLMSMKRAAGRTKDLADLEELEAIQRLRRRA